MQPRGATRLYGARGKKQVWRAHALIWGLSEEHLLYCRKYFYIVGIFRAPIVIWRPGTAPPLPPSLRPDATQSGHDFDWYCAPVLHHVSPVATGAWVGLAHQITL